MKTLAELRGERREVIDAAKGIRDAAKSAGRDLSDAELRQVEGHLATADRLALEMSRANGGSETDRKIADAEAGLLPLKGGRGNPSHGNPDAHHTRHAGRGRGHTYEALFGAPQGGGDGFASFGSWLQVLSSGRYHDRMVPVAGAVESEGAAGGFLVPEIFASEMLNKAIEQTIIVQRADVRPMTAPTLKVAGLDDSSHSSHLYGGLTGDWITEAGTITNTEPKVRRIQLSVKKLACLSKSSNELAEDAPDFERLLGDALVAGLSWYLDLACLTGTGAGQPLGILNDPALITVAKESSQGAATIQFENLTKMLARCHPACVGNCVWIANPTTIPQLLQLTIRVQNSAGSDFVGGSHVPVMSESNGQFKMLTRPVFFTEKLPALGTKGDLILCDPSQYVLGLRKQVSVEKSQHVYFASDESAYRAILRADGQGKWASPMTPKNGDTLSWCVALATRS